MSGNNFVTNKGNTEKVKQEKQEKEIVWTSPDVSIKESGGKNSIDNKPLEENRKGFFSFSKKSPNVNSGDDSGFAGKKRILSKYNKVLKREKQNKNFFVEKNTKTVVKDSNQKKSRKNVLSLANLKSGVNKADNSGFPSEVTLKTNLIKEDVTTYIDWKKNIILFLMGLVFVVLVIGGFYAQLIYEEYRFDLEGKGLDSEIEVLNVKINNIEEQNQEIVEFQEKLNIASSLLDNHIYWTNFFKFLEENTLSNTYYTSSVSGNTAGVFDFEAITKNYGSIDDQLRVLRSTEHVLKAKVLSGVIDKENKGEEDKKTRDGVSYSLELKLSPDIFKIKNQHD
ncbi:hypothetical protein KAU09_02245 [Candidatus Parcubacteria bacterium]|nr:hypothetical protein [Candidatus Parcubacteria bacterium]